MSDQPQSGDTVRVTFDAKYGEEWNGGHNLTHQPSDWDIQAPPGSTVQVLGRAGRTVLQHAANIASLLGDAPSAERFEDAHEDHDGKPCWHNNCVPEKRARDYLAEHTDGDNIVMHIGFDLPTFAELAERHNKRAQTTYNKVAEAYRQLWEQIRPTEDDTDTDLADRIGAVVFDVVRRYPQPAPFLGKALGWGATEREIGAAVVEQVVKPLHAERDLLLWLHAEAVHKATLCGAVGYWGARNTRYECDKPKHHTEKLHEKNRGEDIPVAWFGHHPTPAVDVEETDRG